MRPERKPWTDAEIRTLRDYCLRQRPFDEIVAALPGRTYAACTAKASALGLANFRCRSMQGIRSYTSNQRVGRT